MPIPVSATAISKIHRRARACPDRQIDLAFLGEFERIGQQLHQNLLKLLTVTLDGIEGSIDMDAELDRPRPNQVAASSFQAAPRFL